MCLKEEIRTLKQQVVSLRTNLRSKSDEVEQYKVCSLRSVTYSLTEFGKMKTNKRNIFLEVWVDKGVESA